MIVNQYQHVNNTSTNDNPIARL